MATSLAVTLGALVTAACGSTVAGTSSGAALSGVAPGAAALGGSSTTTGLVGSDSPAQASGPAATGVNAAAAGSTGTAAADATGGAIAGDSTGAAAQRVTASGSAPGVTATTIKVGVPYTANGEAANAALGASAITRGDEKGYMTAVIDDINERGGVAGRKLSPVYFAYDAQSADSKDAQDQAACAALTQDNHVFVSFAGGLTENFDACLAKAGVAKLSSGRLINEDAAYFRKYATSFNLSVPSQDRMMADQVATLKKLNYFTGWNPSTGQAGPNPVKVGILSVDTPKWARPLRSVLLPRLSAIGHAVDSANVVEVYNPSSTADTGKTASDLQNATLKFQSNGVTHVLVLDANGSLTLLWAPNAKNQRYFPRLGVNSATGAQALKDAGIMGNDQLNGAMGLGWFPSLDLPAAETTKYATAQTNRCLELIKKKTGQTFTSTNAASLALTKCDMGWFFELAGRSVGGALNLQSITSAIEAVGDAYRPALTPSVRISAGRHDGIVQGYEITWDTGCTCAKYVGKHRIA
jgi:hypothetical protein